ncbi:MAG: hypothetical protein AAF512_05610 [Pseudomonadota bacterium]
MTKPSNELLRQKLSPAENFVLTAMRHWVGGLKADSEDDETFERHIKSLKSAFAHVGGCAGLRAFEYFMLLLSEHSHKMIDVRCAKCSSVSEDEKRLIDTAAAFQYGYGQYAETLLSFYLPSQYLVQAACHARRFVRGMEADDCELPKPALDPMSTNRLLNHAFTSYAGTTIH